MLHATKIEQTAKEKGGLALTFDRSLGRVVQLAHLRSSTDQKYLDGEGRQSSHEWLHDAGCRELRARVECWTC